MILRDDAATVVINGDIASASGAHEMRLSKRGKIILAAFLSGHDTDVPRQRSHRVSVHFSSDPFAD